MSEELEIRESVAGDYDAIVSLYPQAFRDEDLVPLVRELLSDTAVTLSFVAVIDAQITGHVILTKCGVAGSGISAALLGPLAVAPARQRQGIGSAIVRCGLRRLEDVDLVCVLGDPGYYKRFGFLPESRVEPPFRLPVEWSDAWQSLCIDNEKLQRPGKLLVPRQWLKPALWAP